MNIAFKIIILISCFVINTSCNRINLNFNSDSILDIINTRHVERVMGERRFNASREAKNYLMQNGIDEDATEVDPDTYQTPEVSIDFEFNARRQSARNGGGTQASSDNGVMQYNDTVSYAPGAEGASLRYPDGAGDIISDMQAFRGDKLLKSSKNALYITRKEYLKRDWCKSEPLVQRIREEGCLTRTIINRFCYGQCNSFYIPKSPKRKRRHPTDSLSHDFEDEDLTGPAFKSCSFCKPKKFTWITVTLRCPSLEPQLRRKRIQRIKQCKCIAETFN